MNPHANLPPQAVGRNPIEHTLIYTHTLPIRWRDVDPYNVVNHSVYFTYMEETRWHWFHSLPIAKDVRAITTIVEAHIEYKKSLTYPGSMIIKLYGAAPDKNSWTAYHEIAEEGAPTTICAQAWVKLLFIDPHTKRVIPVPEEWKCYLYPNTE